MADPGDPMPTAPPPDVHPVPMPNVATDVCVAYFTTQSNAVFLYQPNEIATSHTEPGHLAQDVVLLTPIGKCQYLYIWDFGVDWRHLKAAAKTHPVLSAQLTRFETDKTLAFQITGYSDCVGNEQNNLFLRLGRARNVFKLLGPDARKRAFAVKASAPHTYLADNSTVLGRAQNRAVVVEIFVGAIGGTI
jgi:hypothetical protein